MVFKKIEKEFYLFFSLLGFWPEQPSTSSLSVSSWTVGHKPLAPPDSVNGAAVGVVAGQPALLFPHPICSGSLDRDPTTDIH